MQLIALAEDEQRLTSRYLSEEARQAVEVQAGLLGKSVPSDYDVIAAAIIYTPFHGVTWSSNISKRHAALSQVISRTMQDYLIKGNNPTDAIPILRREFGYSAKSAKRLLVTEGARVASQMQKYSFEKYGYEEYEYIAEPKACDICKPLNGKIFKVKEMMPGENAAPMHPHCRCSVAAHYTEEKTSETIDSTSEEEYNGIRDSGGVHGAWNNKNDPSEKKRQAHANLFYEEVRNRDTLSEVTAISKNSGFSVNDVLSIYRHIFENEYLLEGGVKRFDSDYDMAESWRRLREGKEIQKHDITLLHHELMESKLMANGMSYDEAHNETEKYYNYSKELRIWLKEKGDT